jgi:hypothetical protein
MLIRFLAYEIRSGDASRKPPLRGIALLLFVNGG